MPQTKQSIRCIFIPTTFTGLRNSKQCLQPFFMKGGKLCSPFTRFKIVADHHLHSLAGLGCCFDNWFRDPGHTSNLQPIALRARTRCEPVEKNQSVLVVEGASSFWFKSTGHVLQAHSRVRCEFFCEGVVVCGEKQTAAGCLH